MASVSVLEPPARTRRKKKTRAELRAERIPQIRNADGTFVRKPFYFLWELAIITGLDESTLAKTFEDNWRLVSDDGIRQVWQIQAGPVFIFPSRRKLKPGETRKRKNPNRNWRLPLDTVLNLTGGKCL